MSQRIGVRCTFSENGRVRVQQIQIGDQWLPVGQGRQWQDENGRHILVMLPNNEVREVALRPDTLLWELLPGRGTTMRWA